jgi:hypothetical protein
MRGFSKDIEILKETKQNNPQMMEMKDSIMVEGITYRLDKAEERISGYEDKVKEILHSGSNKEKNHKQA